MKTITKVFIKVLLKNSKQTFNENENFYEKMCLRKGTSSHETSRYDNDTTVNVPYSK